MSTAIAPPDIFIKQALEKITNIGTLPEVTAKIITTVEDPRSTAAQLNKIVSNDPALATRILKVVNSAFYGVPGQIGSIERAIVMLGLNGVKNIAVAASLGQLFKNVKICDGLEARDVWTHSIAVGVAAREIAKKLKSSAADEAFLAGLIHDSGILVWLQAHPEMFGDICHQAKDSEQDFCQIERDTAGVDHQMLGIALAENWRFPRSCQMAAGYHHRPTSLAKEHRQLVDLVFVADTICCQQGYGFSLTAYHQKIDDIDPAQLGITSAIIDSLLETMPELTSSAMALLG